MAADAFVPDIILGIARGGLIPAGALAYALDCKNLFTISVEFYTGVDSRLEVPVMLLVVRVVNASKGWYERGAAGSRSA